jgi:hypothetical protein
LAAAAAAVPMPSNDEMEKLVLRLWMRRSFQERKKVNAYEIYYDYGGIYF